MKLLVRLTVSLSLVLLLLLVLLPAIAGQSSDGHTVASAGQESTTPTSDVTTTAVPSNTAGSTASAVATFTLTPDATLPTGTQMPSTPSSTPTPTATSSVPTCGLGWELVSSPNPGMLRGIAVISANDAWAAGDTASLIHWDGTEWSTVPSPQPGTSNILYSIAAVSSDDVWAVGSTFTSPLQRPLVLHWDGAKWSEVTVPPPAPGATGQSSLLGITAISANDIWAVGNYHPFGGMQSVTLTMHWDGTEWSVVPSPNATSYMNALNSVSSTGPDDVWAVGYSNVDGTYRMYNSLVLHWDGVEWSISPHADPGDVSDYMNGVTAIASDDVWTVGNTPDFQHWDGTSWQLMTVGEPRGAFYAIDGLTSDDVWAVGYYGIGTFTFQTYIMHWDGSAWSRVPSPNLNEEHHNQLQGVAARASDDVWAVGGTSEGSSIIMRYHNLPCPTATTIPTATATSCPIQFTDVPQSSTFYANVRCLACRGILGGYTDGTFRPNNNITRGQLSKIVSNAGGFAEPVSGQLFEDVPPSHTFYEWVQRLAGRGYIGGYQCGGENEPCVPPLSRPYFRPGNNATRGQISKIVSNAVGFADPPGVQLFEDVTPGSAFYEWVQRLATRGIMGGYPCGGAGEPCGANNKPYFRPNNNATRGQVSKIVANTFFPGCQTP